MSRETRRLGLAFAAIAVAVLALAGRDLDEPGLYYDEAIQAVPAAELVRGGGEPLHVPGARSARLFGHWLPLMTQPYMGALKSQLLVVPFAVFGAGEASLRLTTLAWGLLGIGLLGLWMRESFGSGAALVATALLALDPSTVFATRHDWGSVSLGLVCRGGGLLALARGWRRGSAPTLAAGGLLLGLGIYNKIDFAAFVVGAGAAWLAVAPPDQRRLRRPGHAAAAGAGLLLGAAPMLAALAGVLDAARGMLRSAGLRGGDLAEKLHAWAAFLDGSYFHRLMLVGGDFDRMAQAPGAASGPFGWLFAASAALLAAGLARDARRRGVDRGEAFALAATLITALALLAMPRAARLHHLMNVTPLPQLVVALAARRLWIAGRRPARALAALGIAAALAGHLAVDLATLRTIHASGGRGRWSRALTDFARELPADAAVVSLDWGFHTQLRLLRPELELAEPFWRMRASRPPGPGQALAGGPRHVYLVQAPGYEVFDVGGALLDAVRRLPPGAAVVRDHTDREGSPAFRSIRFARPHELVYRGAFEVRLR